MILQIQTAFMDYNSCVLIGGFICQVVNKHTKNVTVQHIHARASKQGVGESYKV